MTYSVRVDEKASEFFRNFIREEAQVRNFVESFMRDIEQNVPAEESFKTMSGWQNFLLILMGPLEYVAEEDIADLEKVLRQNRTDKCSMVTQALAKKYSALKDEIEAPLYDAHGIFLPRIESFK